MRSDGHRFREEIIIMKANILKYAGVAASVVLIVFGIASIAVGAAGRGTVHDNLKAEKIVGTPDMTPAAIKAEGAKAGLENVDYPTCSVAGKAIDNGTRARCFAEYMRIHGLEATGGKVYAQMARDDPKRDTWVSETALSTALNTSYFAENVALFSVVMGIALLLTGIGFLVVTLGGLARQPQRKRVESASTGKGLVGSPAGGATSL
jgi:hypothetical protein